MKLSSILKDNGAARGRFPLFLLGHCLADVAIWCLLAASLIIVPVVVTWMLARYVVAGAWKLTRSALWPRLASAWADFRTREPGLWPLRAAAALVGVSATDWNIEREQFERLKSDLGKR